MELNRTKMPAIYECNPCHFKCSKLSNLKAHLLTRKHEIRTSSNEKNADLQNTFYCKKCNKPYIVRNSLWYHEKKCNFIQSDENVVENTEDEDPDDKDYEMEVFNMKNMPIDGRLLIELVKNTQEFKNLLIEQNAKINELAQQQSLIQNNITNNNNTTNNSFNLNVFLNEKCKDAVNLMDFVNSLQVQLSEFEATGRLGYVEGISSIVINRLKTMEVRKRPIHCTDSKRETMYIKDDDTWEKEDAHRPKLSKALKIVADKNFQKMLEWQKVYPECVVNNTKENDYFFKIISSALGGNTPEEDAKNEDKIIRNIAREVVIDKTAF